MNKKKSTSLVDWIPIFTVPNCFFITLQHGDIEDEIRDFERDHNFSIHQDKEVDPMSEFDDFAAQIASLNLVISISNATTHLAGALGVNTLTLLTKFLVGFGCKMEKMLYGMTTRNYLDKMLTGIGNLFFQKLDQH